MNFVSNSEGSTLRILNKTHASIGQHDILDCGIER